MDTDVFSLSSQGLALCRVVPTPRTGERFLLPLTACQSSRDTIITDAQPIWWQQGSTALVFKKGILRLDCRKGAIVDRQAIDIYCWEGSLAEWNPPVGQSRAHRPVFPPYTYENNTSVCYIIADRKVILILLWLIAIILFIKVMRMVKIGAKSNVLFCYLQKVSYQKEGFPHNNLRIPHLPCFLVCFFFFFFWWVPILWARSIQGPVHRAEVIISRSVMKLFRHNAKSRDFYRLYFYILILFALVQDGLSLFSLPWNAVIFKL